jgi:hypothetical protein
MTDHHLVSTWRLQASIEQVREKIVHTERWPSWWKYLQHVDELDPGDSDRLGRRQHLESRPGCPKERVFDIQVRRVERPTMLESVATGGAGRRGTLDALPGGRRDAGPL